MLGAGGAARAIIVALLEDGVPAIRLVNRTAARAAALAAEFGPLIRPVDWTRRADALAEAALLVNTPSPSTAGLPRRRAAARSGVSSGA